MARASRLRKKKVGHGPNLIIWDDDVAVSWFVIYGDYGD